MEIYPTSFYIEQPNEFIARGESNGFVCRLQKTIYGLKHNILEQGLVDLV